MNDETRMRVANEQENLTSFAVELFEFLMPAPNRAQVENVRECVARRIGAQLTSIVGDLAAKLEEAENALDEVRAAPAKPVCDTCEGTGHVCYRVDTYSYFGVTAMDHGAQPCPHCSDQASRIKKLLPADKEAAWDKAAGAVFYDLTVKLTAAQVEIGRLKNELRMALKAVEAFEGGK